MVGRKTIGVLALQGAFIEHQAVLNRCNVTAVKARTKEDIRSIDGLIIPGGESTTIGRLLQDYDLGDTIIERAREGLPVYGTCAGMIVMAKEIPGHSQYSLGLMDMSVKRNAFGRQVDSFEANLSIKGMNQVFKGVFIRAPYADRCWGAAEVLSQYEDRIIMVREGNLLASAFHPELTRDPAIHKYFLAMT